VNGCRSPKSAFSSRSGKAVSIWRSYLSGSTPKARQVSIIPWSYYIDAPVHADGTAAVIEALGVQAALSNLVLLDPHDRLNGSVIGTEIELPHYLGLSFGGTFMREEDQHKTDAKNAGDRLVAGRGREDPFAAAFKATRMPMIVTDPSQDDNPIIFCNASFERLTGYTSEELVGRNCRLLQGPDTDKATVARIREAVGAGRDVAVDIMNYRKDGSTFWNVLFISPVRDDEGRIVYFFASQVDFTDVKSREADLAAARHQAEEEVAKNTADLQAALEAKTLLVHEVDHRVKNNLLTMASIVKLQARTTRDESRRGTLMAVLNRVEALSTVQRKLFTLNDVSRFDVSDFARELVTDLIGGIGRDDIHLTLDLQPLYVPAVKATPLSLIVNELIGDAVRRGLCDSGGEIHVVVKRLNGHFLMRVEDTVEPVEPDPESAEFSRLLLEASARQLGAKIERSSLGRKTVVDVTLLVDEHQESEH
jgi:PAS domain S-box-containing protein